MSVTDMAAEAARKAMETAETVTMDGNAFRAMVAVLQAASGDMLHRHVMAIQAAIETAKPVTAPEAVSGPSARQAAAAASNAAREAAKLAERRAENAQARVARETRELIDRHLGANVDAISWEARLADGGITEMDRRPILGPPNAGSPVDTVQAG